jgi:cysteine desulfurase / selenocysteine lyase
MSSIRDDFPILRRELRGQPLVYLDSAATTQKPDVVIRAIADYYTQHNANVHRAAHVLAEEATILLEEARTLTQLYIGAQDSKEIIFTRGTTESINLVANILTSRLSAEDEILITELEHHSNIVPWQMLSQRTGAKLRAVKVTAEGELDLDDFHAKLNTATKLFTCNHISNALGTVNPVSDLVNAAKSVGALTLIDGAQATLHQNLDMGTLDCDFYVFSGHKMFAPTGIGVLYGKLALLADLPPWQGGGEMIEHVTIDASTYQEPPYKFEAGTPNISGAVGLGAAIKYLQQIPRENLVQAENRLVADLVSHMKQIPGVRLIGEPNQRSAVISFLMEGAHPHDVGTLLDQQGVAVRTGHHCAMPLMQALNIPGTIRASFSLYSNQYDVDRFTQALDKAATFI